MFSTFSNRKSCMMFPRGFPALPQILNRIGLLLRVALGVATDSWKWGPRCLQPFWQKPSLWCSWGRSGTLLWEGHSTARLPPPVFDYQVGLWHFGALRYFLEQYHIQMHLKASDLWNPPLLHSYHCTETQNSKVKHCFSPSSALLFLLSTQYLWNRAWTWTLCEHFRYSSNSEHKHW